MPRQRERQDNLDLFVERYTRTRSQALREVERTVFGADIGLGGYTTISQADLLVEHLRLNQDARLLDLGAGRGWPGVHVAEATGCRLFSSDVTTEALAGARENMSKWQLGVAPSVLAADGRALPFRTGFFDALVHADVFC